MDLSAINWLAVVAAVLPGFVVGFFWYGPLLGKAWMRESGMTEDKIAQSNMARTFSLAFVFQFVMGVLSGNVLLQRPRIGGIWLPPAAGCCTDF